MGRNPKLAYSYIRVDNQLIATGKNCSVCKVGKPYEEFHRLWRSADGRQPKCKACKVTENSKRCRSS